MLSQAAYLTRLYGAFHLPVRGQPDPAGTTLLARIGSWDALGLSPRRQRRIRAQLAADGLLVTWLGSVPQRRWYRVDLAAYDELVPDTAGGDKSSPPAVSEHHPRQPQAGSTSDDGTTGPAVPDRAHQRSRPGTATKQTDETDVDVPDTGPRTDARAGDGTVTHDHRGDDPQPPLPVAAVIDHLSQRGRHPAALRHALICRWRDGDLHVTPDDIPKRVIHEAARRGEAREAVIARILRLCRQPSAEAAVAAQPAPEHPADQPPSTDPPVASPKVARNGLRDCYHAIGIRPEPSDSDDD